MTKHSNPAAHCLNFSNLYQHEHKSIKDYLVCLKTSDIDCEFSCPNCSHDLLTAYVKDQFIWGMQNDALQTDLLPKTDMLKLLEDIVKHTEAFEIAVQDQQALQNSNYNKLMATKISDHKKTKFWLW